MLGSAEKKTVLSLMNEHYTNRFIIVQLKGKNYKEMKSKSTTKKKKKKKKKKNPDQ